MDQCPHYHQPVIEYDSTFRLETYRAATKLFQDKKWEESVRTLLSSINQDMAQRCEKEKNHWLIPHGSLFVEIRITPDGYVVLSAPFVKLPPDRRAPPLRQAVEINTFNLKLAQLILQDDGLTYTFRTPLALAEPGKMYGVLSEICLSGDSYDDEFISKFGAQALRQKEVTALPAEQVDQAWRMFQDILGEAKRYSDFYATKRWHGFNFEIQGIALYRIDHAIAPQGYLRTRLERSVSHVWDKRSAEEIARILSTDLEEFRKIERGGFDGDFYKARFFINAKRSTEIQACKMQMAQRWAWAQEDRAHNNTQGVSFCYLFAGYNLLYSFFLPPNLRQEVVTTLTAMGGKPWDAAGELAWASFQKIMDPAFA